MIILRDSRIESGHFISAKLHPQGNTAQNVQFRGWYTGIYGTGIPTSRYV
jgi:hypothetical protein